MPGDTGVTKPVALPTVAIPAVVVLQTPPASVFDNVSGIPKHVVSPPVGAEGLGCTVTTLETLQPIPNV